MKTLPVMLEDDLDAAVAIVSIRQEHLRQSLQATALIALYEELAAEDVALAESGMADYQEGLELADHVERF